MNNRFIPGRFGGSALSAARDSSTNTGGDNSFVGNTLDGGWTGPAIDATRDIDDGIVLSGESNDVVRDNTIRNYFDCGIETAGTVVNSTIENNTIEHAGLCGIGGWYANSWQNNSVSNNDVSSAQYLFTFFWVVPPSGDMGDGGFFRNNRFVGNRFRSPLSGGSYSATFVLDNVPAGQGAVTGNLIQGNDFGTQLRGPRLTPVQGFINGGGNTCGSGGSIVCN